MPPTSRTARRALGDATPSFRSDLRSPSLYPAAKVAGGIFHQHHDADDDQQDRCGGIEFVAVERGVQRRADAAAADDADHCGFAEVDVETVEAEPDHARHHLRLEDR